jgi:hypothetical protein
MKKLLVAALAACALAVAGPAGAALVIAPYEGVPGTTCTVNTYSHGVLHLEKTCPTTANAAAGADITGFSGQTFSSASFTLAGATQCNGGSPRFDILDANGNVYFLGCNNVTPVTNANGTVTYSFTMADLLRINSTLPAPTTIQAVDVAVDVQGVADISRIFFNGVLQVPTGATTDQKNACKDGGWKSFANPAFKNQGQCVSYFEHQNGKGADDEKTVAKVDSHPAAHHAKKAKKSKHHHS